MENTDYKKMYEELKAQHEQDTLTFNNVKEELEKVKSGIETEYQQYREQAEKEILDLKQTNISLFLKVPKEPTEEQKKQEEPEKKVSTADLVNDLINGGI